MKTETALVRNDENVPSPEEDPRVVKLRERIVKMQHSLWRLERKLGLPKEDTKLLPKGFKSLDLVELEDLEREFQRLLGWREAEYRRRGAPKDREGLSAKQRKVVDLFNGLRELLKDCEKTGIFLDREDEYPFLPKGFRSMKGEKLEAFNDGFANMFAKYDEQLQLKLSANIERERERDRKNTEWHETRAKMKAASDEVATLVEPLNTLLDRLREHPEFRLIRIPRITVPGRDGVSILYGKSTDSEEMKREALAEMKRVKRSLREPLRRRWQSARSRRVTHLAFRDYMAQEGFADLLS